MRTLLETSNKESEKREAKKCFLRECSFKFRKIEEEFKNWNISLPKQLESLIIELLLLSIYTNNWRIKKNKKIKNCRNGKKNYYK